MSILKELEELYLEIDSRYAEEEFEARSIGSHTKEQEISKKRELNDHAYFLFLFTRFEDHVRDQSSLLIVEKQTNLKDWRQRRAWDILPPKKEADSLFFLNRVALLVDKGSHHFKKIKSYYELRNILGHGGTFSSPVSIPTVVADFETYFRMLKV